MNTSMALLDSLEKKISDPWAERILSQLKFACKLSEVQGGKFDGTIKGALKFLDATVREQGALTKSAVQTAEGMIKELSQEAKLYQVICAAHAHIDMNWMWGFAETVAITLDTFRTMLNLMNEYPEFTFSQSQASVYRIVEEYDPWMLEEIKKRVKEGRWEVTASTWVETDKNMPNGESLTRHILYTKKYLSGLLDVPQESLKLDFEPDTFGHSQTVPEILNHGGVKYYYHCRGYDGHHIYRWQAPSGKSVLVYRDLYWYNASIQPDMVLFIPEFCAKYDTNTALKVYGVGDHGGGPTRRDIEKLIEMGNWPVFPSIRFGSFHEFFGILEKQKEKFPVVEGELNFIFTGCYTSQTRIKMANRVAEAKLNEAEAYSAIAKSFASGRYRTDSFEKAWEKTLFNHFHDILPGSGVIDTREYALGQFQEILAVTNTEISTALNCIASKINTSGLVNLEEDCDDTISEGAGVGYAIKDFNLPQTERGKGKSRIFHLFNSSAVKRNEPVELTVWDWPADKDRIVIKDSEGKETRFQRMENDILPWQQVPYWGHEYMRLLVNVNVPAYGYSTYVLEEKEIECAPVNLPSDPRTENPQSFILENDFVKTVFDTQNALLLSIVDKKTGREMLDSKKPSAVFRLIEEDDSKGMTAWVVGRYMNIISLHKDVKVERFNSGKNLLRQWIAYSIAFRRSKLHVKVSLDHNSTQLNFEVECDWQEVAERDKHIPQLNFAIPLAYKCRLYRYDIPFGTIERQELDMDVPGNSWMLAVPEEAVTKALMIITGTKYGFRGFNDTMSLSLIRSSYDPDPYPENGIHRFKFAIAVVETDSSHELIQQAYHFNHPVSFISGTRHRGLLPCTQSFIALLSGSAAISAIKLPEKDNSGKKWIIRLYETDGKDTIVKLQFAADVAAASFVDIHENILGESKGVPKIQDRILEFDLNAYCIENVLVEL